MRVLVQLADPQCCLLGDVEGQRAADHHCISSQVEELDCHRLNLVLGSLKEIALVVQGVAASANDSRWQR